MRLDIETVKNEFKKVNYKLITKKYNTNQDQLQVKCDIHYNLCYFSFWS